MPYIRQLYINSLVITLGWLVTFPAVVHAQEAAKEVTSIPCVTLSRIQNIDIIDNQNVVFQTGNNQYYLNKLPYRCNGLRFNDGILYRTSLNELCSVDVISVLDSVGPGYQAGPSCGLGRFEPITKEEIKTLKDSLKKEVSAK